MSNSRTVTPNEALATFRAAPAGSTFAVAINGECGNFATVTRKEALLILARFGDRSYSCATEYVRIEVDKFAQLPACYWIHGSERNAT